MKSHLYASLIELGDTGQLLSVVDVRILVLSEGHFQLFQLLVAEGGALSSPGWGGVGPAPPAKADTQGGLTQRPLPHRLSYICFQEEENAEKTLTLLQTILQLLFLQLLGMIRKSGLNL